MSKRGDRVRIITDKYAGHTGTVESNVYQRTMDYPDELNNGYHIMLDIEELVMVRCERATRLVQAALSTIFVDIIQAPL